MSALVVGEDLATQEKAGNKSVLDKITSLENVWSAEKVRVCSLAKIPAAM